MVKLYVEGGGDAAALKSSCREGFTNFITKAGVSKRPRIVACGSRHDAYESFLIAITSGDEAMLLVDAEKGVSDEHEKGEPSTWLPWAHLKQHEGWVAPPATLDIDCHLMVQVMESWFLADRDTLRTFFGNGFKENQLPAAENLIEHVKKADIYRALENATKSCKTMGAYGKGEHSFKLLASINPCQGYRCLALGEAVHRRTEKKDGRMKRTR